MPHIPQTLSVAEIIDELGIVEIQPGEIVNAGLVVKAMILNGLGFVSRPLYLFPQFFQDIEWIPE